MVLITALEAVCDLLPYFAVAALFKAYDAPGLLIGASLLLVFCASLLLQKTKAAALRILCGLLPALSLLLAGGTAQLLFTLPALLLWFVIAVSGKCGIHYDDYKYWFGIPAVPTLLILLISVPRLPETGLSVLCGAAYLALGILVLRRKRMGAGASAGAKLLNLAELFCAALCGILACAVLYFLLKSAGRVIEILFAPAGWLIGGLVSVFEWITAILVRYQPPEESSVYESSSLSGDEMLPPETVIPGTEEPSYAWAESLGQSLLYVLGLAVLVLLVYLVYKAIRNLRISGKGEGLAYEDMDSERMIAGKKRKKRKKQERTNNHRIREIYREYLAFVRLNGVEIAKQSTSAEVLAAASALPGGSEADQLRALYIRARYHDRQELSDEEVRLAEALLQKIKTEVEDENRRKIEAQYHA